MPKQCPHCYTLNNDDSTFCNKCGTNLVTQNINQPIKQKSTDNFIFIIIILILIIFTLPAVLLYLI